jgi:pilus assembly protein CpaC
MRFYLILLFSVLSILAATDANAEPTKSVVTGVGSSIEIAVPRAGQIRVSNSSVLRAEDLGSRLRLVGKKSGSAVVQAGGLTWAVSVLTSNDYDTYKRLETSVRKMRGLILSVQDGVARVDGRLLRASDWQSLTLLENMNYRFAATLDESLATSLRAEVQKSFVEAQLPVPSFQLSPEAKVFLTQDQAALLPAYEKAVARWGLAVEINPTLVTLAPLVRIKIVVAEVRKSFSQKFGVTWPGGTTAQLLPSWIAPGKLAGVQVSLDALEAQGLGRVLASPNLLCRSGKQAEFLAGGEFPIKITSFAAQDVTWKKYGVLLKAAPVADSMGRMSIALTTEVSAIDATHTVEGIPGLLMNRIESHFDLAHSQTIALSGLIKKEWNTNREGLPWLSRIPILGSLFSSREYQNDQSELIVFVTPEVVHPEEGVNL